MITTKRNARFSVPAAIICCLFFAVGVSAQVETGATSTSGQPSVETQVERGQVVTVNGNDLVVKMEDGSLRHFANVPESAKVTVEGKELGIHDLKPGMKLERTITTTTTPKTITTTQTVTGTVFHVNAPNSVTLRLEDGTTEQFKIPKGQKFMVEGQETDAFGLRKGMKISATKIVEEPQTVVEQQKQVTGTMPSSGTPGSRSANPGCRCSGASPSCNGRETAKHRYANSLAGVLGTAIPLFRRRALGR